MSDEVNMLEDMDEDTRMPFREDIKYHDCSTNVINYIIYVIVHLSNTWKGEL